MRGIHDFWMNVGSQQNFLSINAIFVGYIFQDLFYAVPVNVDKWDLNRRKISCSWFAKIGFLTHFSTLSISIWHQGILCESICVLLIKAFFCQRDWGKTHWKVVFASWQVCYMIRFLNYCQKRVRSRHRHHWWKNIRRVHRADIIGNGLQSKRLKLRKRVHFERLDDEEGKICIVNDIIR